MEKEIKKEIKAFLVTAVIIGFFSTSIWILPPLGDLINPNGPFWNQTKGPFGYPEYEVFKDPNLHGDKVVVYRDEYGVPHVYAEDYRDLFYVYGYLQASDRFFEMMLFKLVGYGRLSEVAGSLTIPLDKYMRTISLWKSAEDLIEIAKENKEEYERAYNMIDEFSKGVNKWINTHQHDLPIEFSIMDIPVESWSMLDSALMANLAGLMLSWVTEDLNMETLRLTMGDYLEENGEYGVSLDDLFPLWNMSYPYETPIIPDNHSLFPQSEDNSHGIYSMNLLETIYGLSHIESVVLKSLKDSIFRFFLEPFFRRFEWGIGSNNWVVGGANTTTGLPILCGDPHLMLMAPSVWYEAHLVCIDEEMEELRDPRDPSIKYYFKKTYNSYGVSFPGTPVILIGHNEHCAWSETNVGSDSFIDFYAETLNEEEDKYKYMGEWKDLHIIDSPILVKNGPIKYEEPFQIRYTRHGPILTDVLSVLEGVPYLGGSAPEDYEHLSVKYIGYNNSDLYNQLVAFDLLNRAENVFQMKTALQYYPNPPQNFVVSDDSGNIGMICAGLFPMRAKYSDTENWEGAWIYKEEYTGRYIQPGDGSGQEWIGFVPPEHIPHCINPPNQSYLASANQRTIAASIYNYSIGHIWSANWRARSINRYLNVSNPHSPYYRKKISFNDLQDIQYSDYDIAAQNYVPVILEAYNSLTQSGKDEFSSDFKEAIDYLTEWNNSANYRYHMDKYLIAPTIFEEWMKILPENLWGDEWNDAEATGSYPDAQITEFWIMNKTEDDPFFDNLETSKTENKTDIILETLEEAVNKLEKKYGSIGSSWIWGNHHQLALIGTPLILSVLAGNDPESWPIHGSGRVLNNAPIIDFKIEEGPISFDASQYVFGGPSWRQVIDFSHIERSVGVLPGGTSGNPLNPHYTDQVDLWVDGNYKELIFHEETEDWVEDDITATQEWYKWDY
ncbi:MAG: penicillin acylase family protein [Promethearchaeota archaeon]|nr:MAG: penicillin acylase family protein [Candidatus Lokiarchaeota archaeon]